MEQRHNNDVPGPELSLFSRLVAMLAGIALQQMGRIPDPVTGQPVRRLQDAQAFIDILEELQRKTRGNLTADEENFLGETLASLRLTFVSALEETPAQPTSSPQAAASQTPPAPPPPEAKDAREQSEQPKSEDSKVRFRKSYG